MKPRRSVLYMPGANTRAMEKARGLSYVQKADGNNAPAIYVFERESGKPLKGVTLPIRGTR